MSDTAEYSMRRRGTRHKLLRDGQTIAVLEQKLDCTVPAYVWLAFFSEVFGLEVAEDEDDNGE